MRRMMKTTEVAAQLGISQRKVCVLIKHGHLTAIWIGNRWRVFPESVDAFEQKMKNILEGDVK